MTTGITVGGSASTKLIRNRVSGYSEGVSVQDAAGLTTLNGDLLAGSTSVGLVAEDNDDSGDSAVSATNVTVAADSGATEDVLVFGAKLALDSTIVGDLGLTATDPGSDPPSCTIAFSRGPVATPGGAGCANFQTTADPQFVGAGDLHIKSTSPMIDAGNPADPTVGSIDLDGDPRKLNGVGLCRRDIGADEFVPETPGDCQAPDTSITSGPSGATSDSTPTFGLGSTEPGSTFECRVDGGGFNSCSNPHTVASLGDGAHTFEVRATDSAANVDATPASRTFSIDTLAPDSSISKGPKKKLKTKKSKVKVKFQFGSSDDDAGFECQLDKAAFAPCSGTFTAKVKKGKHTFSVRASDAVGNVDQSPATRSFTVKRKKK